MVEVAGLYKSFGRQQVLNNVNLSIKEGEINAILGHNGSGKTTLIKSLLGLVIPDAGQIKINGKIIAREHEYRKDIGYMSQIARFPANLTVKELFRMVKDIGNHIVDETPLVESFNLLPEMNKSLRYLSGGTKQKVNACLALMHNPKLLICDEPTVGLDPVSLVLLKDLLRKGRENGQTIILITHIMSLVEELADNVTFIQDGVVYFKGTVSELKASQKENNLERAIAKMMKEKYV